jgi:RimJ/RimL family protein N-acetyltransferase
MLEGSLVRLRVADSTDADYVRRLRNAPGVASRFQDRWFISDERQAKFMAHISETKDTLLLIAEDKATGKPFGVYTLMRIDHRNQRADTGVFLDEAQTPSGMHPLEGACLLFDYAFNYLNLRKLCAEVLADNARALRYNEALGFVVEGTLKEHVFYDGALRDLVLIGLFAPAFEAGEMAGRVRKGWGETTP